MRSDRDRLRRAARYLPLLLAFVVVTSLVSTRRNDWFQFWYAGHLVATGASVYDQTAWVAAPATYGARADVVRFNCPTPDAPACRWVYPPWTAWIYVPFGALDPDIGLAAEEVTFLLLGIAALVILGRALDLRSAAAEAAFLGLAVMSAPFVRMIVTGHFEALEIIGTVLVMRGAHLRSALRVGGGAVLLALKPHLYLVAAIPIAVVLLRRRAWRTIGAATAGLGALALAGIVLSPESVGAILQGAGGKVSIVSASTWAFASNVGGAYAPIVAVSIIGAAVAAFAYSVRAGPRWDERLVAASIALSFVFAPYVQSYDHVQLLPALGLAVALAPHRRRALTAVALMGAFVLASWGAYALENAGDARTYAALLPLGALAALAVASGRMTERERLVSPRVPPRAGREVLEPSD